MRYRIIGTERASGGEVDKTIEAATFADAEATAQSRGYLVERIEQLSKPSGATAASPAPQVRRGMKFRVVGVNRQTGADVNNFVEAGTPAEAEAAANALGVLVERVERIERIERVPPRPLPPAPVAAKTQQGSPALGGLIILLVIGGCYVGFATCNGDEDQRQAADQARTILNRPTSSVWSPRAIKLLLRGTLSESNRGVSRIDSVELTTESGGRKIVSVTWAINDNLTKRFIRGGALRDVVKILRAVDDSEMDYAAVQLRGTFPLDDAYGQSNTRDVIKADLTRATVDRINWDRFIPEDIPRVADSWYLHPALK
ncbi:MAG: hypothetical protein GY778_13705 [bacterium]|nr:hypothetical protein [bacterium]